MTAPVDLAALHEGHRARQAQNAVAVQRLVAQLFKQLIDPQNITATTQAWLTQAIQVILRGREASYLLASAYATAIRRIQVPDAPTFNVPRPDDPPLQQLARSLIYTGPGKLAVDLAKVPEPVEPPESAPQFEHVDYDRELKAFQKRLLELPGKAAITASAAAYKHVTDGGRDTTQAILRSDPVAVGYMRITKTAPCAFCLMLTSRGPVYKDDSFDRSDPRFEGEGEHKVHDSCGCQLAPVYGGKSTKHWTEQGRLAEKLWLEGDGDPDDRRPPTAYSGKDAINAFARAARRQGVADLTRW